MGHANALSFVTGWFLAVLVLVVVAVVALLAGSAAPDSDGPAAWLAAPHGDLRVRVYRPTTAPTAGLVWAHVNRDQAADSIGIRER